MDTIYSYEHSFEHLVNGVNKVAEVVKPTFGPLGSNVIIQDNLRPGHRITNDGKLISDAITLSHPIENIGANILKEAADKMERECGDGRKTTILLTQAILNAGKQSKLSGLELKKQLDQCVPEILKAIDDQAKQIKPEEVWSVASIAAENETIGKLIGKAYEEIGKSGYIEIENSTTAVTHYEISDGYRIHQGFAFPFSTTEQGRAEYITPSVVIVNNDIQNPDQLEEMFRVFKNNQISSIVLLIESISDRAAEIIARLHLSGAFKVLVIKVPTLWKSWVIEDVAKLTGATPIDSKNGKTFKNFEFKDIGSCAKVVSTQDETRIIGTRDITDYLAAIKNKEDDNSRLHASLLQTKIATLKVGANSESELSYFQKKAKDACAAAYWALQDGVVEGGGIALGKSIDSLPATEGGQIMAHALLIPSTAIIQSGITSAEDIVDAAAIVKKSVLAAVSIASSILTAKGVITLHTDEKGMSMVR